MRQLGWKGWLFIFVMVALGGLLNWLVTGESPYDSPKPSHSQAKASNDSP